MSTNYDPMKTIQPFPAHGSDSSDVEPGFKRFVTMPTASDVKRKQLFGIPLKAALTKETLSDETIQEFVVQAISEIEHTLQLYISPVTIRKERHNYAWNEFYSAFGFLTLNHKPILEVQKLEIMIPTAGTSDNFIEWPTAWLKVYNQHGTLQLLPLTGSGSVLVTQASSGVSFPYRLFNVNHYPQFWAITYRVGFDNDALPALMGELIEIIAAIKVLGMLSPVIFPYNSYSISLDGLGQSISTPGPMWFSKRLDDLDKRKQELIAAARSYYELAFSMDVLG